MRLKYSFDELFVLYGSVLRDANHGLRGSRYASLVNLSYTVSISKDIPYIVRPMQIGQCRDPTLAPILGGILQSCVANLGRYNHLGRICGTELEVLRVIDSGHVQEQTGYPRNSPC